MRKFSIYAYWLTAFRALTKAHGSQAKIAELTGVTAKYINDIIAERRGASLKLQERIASALGLAYEEMVAIGRSNTEQQTQHLITLAPNAKQLIKIRGINEIGKETTTHLVIMSDNNVEYIGGMVDMTLPLRAAELKRISLEYWGSGCEISNLDGTKKYLTFDKQMDLPEGLEFVQSQRGNLLSEVEKYTKATGLTLQAADDDGYPETEEEPFSLFLTIEEQQNQLRRKIRNSMQDIYLPETIALTDAIDKLLRENSQFKRSELTMLILSFLKQQGLPEDPL